MDELTHILSEATRSVEGMYFQLNVDGGDPVYRERVYCYELYHQMRCHWPDDSQFYLNGEVDKASHPILTELGAGQAKPDFLVHRPGHMRGNYAIIEVKSPHAPAHAIRADLDKLSLFVSRVGYRRAVYLHYGYDNGSVVERVRRVAATMRGLPTIELWLHSDVGRPAEMVTALRSSI